MKRSFILRTTLNEKVFCELVSIVTGNEKPMFLVSCYFRLTHHFLKHETENYNKALNLYNFTCDYINKKP